jgi:hypothetical protein
MTILFHVKVGPKNLTYLIFILRVVTSRQYSFIVMKKEKEKEKEKTSSFR